MKEEEIKKLATLCRIDLSPEEADKLRANMESILGYISEIKEVVALNSATEGLVGMHRNIMREDEEPHVSGMYTEDILKAVPASEAGYVKVKAIL